MEGKDKKEEMEKSVEPHVVSDYNTAKDALRIYAPTIYSASFTKSLLDHDILKKQVASSLISTYILGYSTQDIGSVLRALVEDPSLVYTKLPLAESVYIDVTQEIEKSSTFDNKRQLKIQIETRKKLHTNIIRYNILFTMMLIGALAAASLYLTKESLALVSAAIGGAITHLLGERTAIRTNLAASSTSKCNNQE